MLRKTILAASLAIATLGGMTLTSGTASAHPPVGHGHQRDLCYTQYQVFIRHYGHWDLFRTFRDRDDAYRVARWLERRGFDAKVERVRGRY